MPTPSVALLLAAGAVVALATLAPSTPEAPLYPDRLHLLRLRDSTGNEKPITTRAGWAKRRAHILANMEKVMGPLPGPEFRVPLEVQYEREETRPGYVLKTLTYASAPGERVPAYLLLPTGRRGKRPAALCLHQTVLIGKDEPVGLGGSPNLHYAQELAERGYVCLVPDYPTLGKHQFEAYSRGWISESMKAVWDNIRGVDLLQSLPEVDGKRIGALGHSLGGHNTLFTAVFEPRLKAMVSNCGFNAFGHYMDGDISGWSGPRYMPRIKTTYPTPAQMPWDFHEVVAALAPRPFLAIAPLHDDNFEVSGVREVMDAAAPVYRLFDAEDRLAARYPDCAHDWPPAEREAAYAWLDRWLKR